MSRSGRWARLLIVIVCTLVGAAVRAYVVRDAPPTIEEQVVVASGAHLVRHHDTHVEAFHRDTPLAAHVTSVPLIGLATSLPPRDPTGPEEQVGWTALHMTAVSASENPEHPPDFVPVQTLVRIVRAPSLVALFLTLLAVVLITDSLFGKGAALVAGLVIAIEPLSALRGGLAVVDPYVQAAVAWLLVAAAVHWERMVGTTDRQLGKENRSAMALGASLGCVLLSSVAAWPVALGILGWLWSRAAAARRRGEKYRGGRGSRCVWATVVCAVFVAGGYLVTDVQAVAQPVFHAIDAWSGAPSEAARAAALPIAWLTIFALLGLPWLFPERADYPALLATAALAGLLTAALAPDHLALPAYAAAVPALAVSVGSAVGFVGTSRSGLTAALGFLIPLGVITALLVRTHEPVQPNDTMHARWFVQRVADTMRPRVLHVIGLDPAEKLEIEGGTRIHRHPSATDEQLLKWLGEERAIVAFAGPVPAVVDARVVARARALTFVE